jgi:hypothetical protein
MIEHRGVVDDLAALLRALPPSRAARKETRRMEQQAGLGGVALVRMNATTRLPTVQARQAAQKPSAFTDPPRTR